MTGGQRPFLGWADELAEFREAFEATADQFAHRRLDPALEERLRDMLAEGTVHHRPASASTRLFADLTEDREPEADPVHAMRYAVEGLVARYAADHPDIVR